MIKRLLLLLVGLVAVAPWLGAQGGNDGDLLQPTDYNKAVDFSKIRFWVGDGSNQAALVLNFDCRGSIMAASNLVYGFRWENEGPTVEQMITAIGEADPLLTECTFADGRVKSIRYKDSFTSNVMSESGSLWLNYLYTAPADAPHEFTLYDGEYTGRSIANGETLVISNRNMESYSLFSLTWLLYRPDIDETGIFIPEELDYFHSGLSFSIPRIVNLELTPDDYLGSAVMTDLNGAEAFSKYYSNSSWSFNPEKFDNGLPLGEFDIDLSITVYGAIFDEDDNWIEDYEHTYRSNACHVSVREPIVPMISAEFEFSRYAFAPGSSIRLTTSTTLSSLLPSAKINVQPANTTYKYVKITSSVKDFFNFEEKYLNLATLTSVQVNPSASGNADIILTCVSDPTNTSSTTISTTDAIKVPVTDISIDELHIPYKGIFGHMDQYVVPEDADIKDLDVIEIEDEKLLKYYASTKDLISYAAGETYVTFKSMDGYGVTKRIKVVVDPPYKFEGDFHDGVFVMNEGWYGHRNTSINFFPREGEPYYNAFDQMNDDLTLGETGSGAMRWGDELYLNCIGNQDPGDWNVGLKSVVVDIATMQPTGKSNPAGNEGIGIGLNRFLSSLSNTYTITDNVTHESTSHTFSAGSISAFGQVKAGKYAFIGAPKHVVVVDPATGDEVKTITGIENAKKMVQSADGNVWLICADGENGAMTGIDATTLEIIKTVDMPAAASFNTKYSWYHPTRFFASTDENALFWVDGNNLYRWDISDDATTCKLLYTDAYGYGAPSYDPERKQILLLMGGLFGYPARVANNVYVDPHTGDCVETLKLPEYYWFPCRTVYPGRYLPEILLESITTPVDKPVIIDLAEYLHDEDPGDLDFNIDPALVDNGDQEIAEITLDDLNRTLTVTPKAEGETSIRLTAMSAGHEVERVIPVKIDKSSGISAIGNATGSVAVSGRHLSVTGHAGERFELLTLSGVAVEAFDVKADAYAATITAPAGIYILRGTGGTVIKVVVK